MGRYKRLIFGYEEVCLSVDSIKDLEISDIDSNKVDLRKVDLRKVYYRVDERRFKEGDTMDSKEYPSKRLYRSERLVQESISNKYPKEKTGLLVFNHAYLAQTYYDWCKTTYPLHYLDPQGILYLYAVVLPKGASPIFSGDGEGVKKYQIIANPPNQVSNENDPIVLKAEKTGKFLRLPEDSGSLLDKAVVVKVLEPKSDT